MKRLILSLALLASLLPAQVVAVRRRLVAAPPSYLLHETFDGTTQCGTAGGGDPWASFTNCNNTWYWGQSITPNSTTAPAPLQGTYSGLATSGAYAMATFTAQDQVYVAWMMQLPSYPVADIAKVRFTTGGTAFTSACYLDIYTNGYVIAMQTGGTNKNTTATLANATTYYYKLRAKKGTGANAECQAWYSTDGKSWTSSGSSTDGTWTAQIDGIMMEPRNSSVDAVIDDIRVSVSDINY